MGHRIVPAVNVRVGVVRGGESRVNVSGWHGAVVVLTLAVVNAPDDMVVDICFIVVSIQVLELMSVVIDEHLDVVDGVVGFVVREVVSPVDVMVLLSWVVVLLFVESSVVTAVVPIVIVMVPEEVSVVVAVVAVVVLVVLIVEVSLVAVVVVLASSEAMEQVTDVTLVEVMLWVVSCGGCMLPLFLHSVFLLLATGLILMWRHAELLFMVLIVVISLVEAVDTVLSMEAVSTVDLVVRVRMNVVLVLVRVVALVMAVVGPRVPVVLMAMVRLGMPVVILEAMHMLIIVRRSMVGVRVVGIVCVMEVSVVGWRHMGIIWVGMACVERDAVFHLLAKEDLRERKANVVTELVVVLVFPLCHGVHELVVDVLAVDDQVVVDVEDEIPGVSESLAHGPELIKVGSNGGLALLELASNVTDDRTEVLDGVEHAVESCMAELVNDTADPLPDVSGVPQTFDSVGNLSLYSASQEALQDFTHPEEGEMYARALHRLELMHFVVLLVVDLV